MIMKRLDMNTYKRTLNLLEHKKVYIFCMLLSCCLYPAYQISSSFVNMYIINGIVEKDFNKLILSFIILLIALILSTVVDPIITYKFNQCINLTIVNLRINLFKQIERLGILQIRKYTAGDLFSRMTNDINEVERLFGNQVYAFLIALIFGIGASVSMFCLNWRFAIIIFIMAIASVTISFYFGPRLNKISTKVQKRHAVLNQFVIDAVLGSKTVKVFHMHDYLCKKYHSENDELIKDEMNRNGINSKISTVNFLINAINVVGGFSIGAYMQTKGIVNFGTIVAVIGLQRGVIAMFEGVGRYYTMIQTALAASVRIFEIMDEKPFTLHSESTDENMIKEAVIQCDDVSFGYTEGEYVINHLSLNISKGDIVLITGQSGIGKSTLLKLILGFYSANKGNIYVRNQLVNDQNIQKIRDDISYVPQDAYLFEDTIKQNIACNRKLNSFDEIVEAAKKANAHDFIMSLPNQYDTKIRENANNLSSGQKQRIAIARAFYKDTPIILMDEPTASLDAESENEVKQALKKLCYEKTVIMISHKPNILENVTRHFVFQNGLLQES